MRKIVIFCLFSIIGIGADAQIVKAKYDYPNGIGGGIKYGFVDANGKWVVPMQYQYAYWYEDWEMGSFRNEENGPEGLLNKWGDIIFPIGKYKKYFVFKMSESNLIEVTGMDGKVGLAKDNGEIIIPCVFKHLNMSTYDEYGVIQVQNDKDMWGVVSNTGKQLIPFEWTQYNFYYYKKHKIIEVKNKEGFVGIISSTGKILIPCMYKELGIYNYPNYVEATDINGKVGLLKNANNKFEVMIPFDFTDTSVRDKYIEVSKNEKKGMYTLDGKLIAKCEYECVKYATDNIAIVNKGGHEENHKMIGGKWGYCANGEEIIPCVYDEVSEFKNDVATVKRDGEVKLVKNPLKDATHIKIADNSPSNKKKMGTVVSRYPAPNSDVDKDIPVAKKQNGNTFAFIVANENYPDAPVPYSLNDGRMFAEYCQKTLGLPKKNINLYEDATFGGIITAVEKMKQIADAYDGEASVIFYYAGHGFPDEKQSNAYLLPIDGNASDITTTGYSLAKFYKELSEMKLKSAVVFLDACFSGAKREDEMLASSRGVAIKVKDETPQGNMVVFSAATGDETAHQMEEKGHGLFTYFLLKELQQTNGDVSLGELTDFVSKQVKRQSVVINNKKQTPTVVPAVGMKENWRNLKLK